MEPRVPLRSFGVGLAGAACAALLLAPTLADAAAPAAGADPAALQRQIETLQHTAQRLDLQRQIDALRARVQQLEKRVRALEARPAPGARAPAGAATAQPAPPAAAPSAAPSGHRPTREQIADRWRALKRGMTPAQVRALLGPPASEGQINPGERLWYYTYPGPRSGSVMFSRDGRVSGWQHPPFGWLW